MYDGLLAMAVVSVLVLLATHALGRLLAVSTDPLPVLPYLSGHAPREHALSRFHVRWYPATVVFLAFDVEMLFMYPWAVVVGRLGVGSIVEMFGFLAALLLSVWWARREGVFQWV